MSSRSHDPAPMMLVVSDTLTIALLFGATIFGLAWAAMRYLRLRRAARHPPAEQQHMWYGGRRAWSVGSGGSKTLAQMDPTELYSWASMYSEGLSRMISPEYYSTGNVNTESFNWAQSALSDFNLAVSNGDIKRVRSLGRSLCQSIPFDHNMSGVSKCAPEWGSALEYYNPDVIMEAKNAGFVPVGTLSKRYVFRDGANIDATLGESRFKQYELTAFEAKGETRPVRVPLMRRQRRRSYWLCCGRFYWEDEGLSADDFRELFYEKWRRSGSTHSDPEVMREAKNAGFVRVGTLRERYVFRDGANIDATRCKRYELSRFEAMARDHAQAVLVFRGWGRSYWLFRGQLYSEGKGLPICDVHALLYEKWRRNKRRGANVRAKRH